MLKTRIMLLCLPLLGALLLAPMGLADDDKTGARIDRILHRMEKGGLEQLWASCADLIDAAYSSSEDVEEMILKAAKDRNSLVKLGCSKALIRLDEVKGVIPWLVGLIHEKEEKPIRISAISIIGTLDYVDEKLKTPLEEALFNLLETEKDPQILVETAKSLYNISIHSYRKKSRKLLKDMLKSDIREIKINAALALAEINDIDSAKSVLEEIRDEPSLEGRMANILIKARDYEAYLVKALREKHLDVTETSSFSQSAFGLELISEIINIIQERHIRGDQFKTKEGVEKLLSAAAKGMLNYMDPHSSYFSQKEHERWMIDLERKYAGIGAYVNTIDGVFTIVRPIYSGPAYEAGLRSGDQIWKVDGWETFNKTNDEIIRHLKGEPDTQVRITVYRPGWKEERDFSISRKQINIPSVNGEVLPGSIGYIEVTQFAAGTGRELALLVNEMIEKGAESLILDLRNNSGGYLNEAVNVCSLFLPPHKLAVFTKGRENQKPRKDYNTRKDMGIRWEGPLVCLINDRSASASEIVAGALQHYKRALIVGEKSYGKGSVQNPMDLTTRQAERFQDSDKNRIYSEGEPFEDLNNNGKYDIGPMLKITSAMYYLPSGRSIHKLRDEDGSVLNEGGITPDVGIKYEGIEAWKEEELANLVEKKVFREYVKKHYDSNKELFLKLAEGDNFDTSLYPDFDAFFESLDCHLSKQDIRKWIRIELRRRTPDDRTPAKPFPGFGFFGDYQEDSQLQAAILKALKKFDVDPHSIDAYAYFADKEFKEPKSLARDDKAEANADSPDKKNLEKDLEN